MRHRPPDRALSIPADPRALAPRSAWSTNRRSRFKRNAVVCDAVYVPLEIGLLAAASGRGHRVVAGLDMLLQRAGYEFRKWFGATPVVTPELRALIEADLEASSPRS